MDYSRLEMRIAAYLGIHEGILPQDIRVGVERAMREIERAESFRHIWCELERFPEFLMREPYISHLAGCRSVIFTLSTLGVETDRLISRYAITDPAYMVVLDAVASAMLETLSDERENALGDDLTFRFCAGYGGSSAEDISEIFKALPSERIGVSLLPSGIMLPQKSMAGIIGRGQRKEKSENICLNCGAKDKCKLRIGGKICFDLEKK